ncbi:energy-coupling factor ABC transporter ATP-binding protein [Enterococcus hirae]|jgi:energy-coupling factor transport system ATP-binding protein|nr:energy-coupling factor ABC transporter ATP-binding protein [Enterococcaceae bacterium]MCI1919668.1 energy-coupling factor ABC transporter ATP-binding protein [Enterococcaceae bacterium]MDM8212511.1 energy-coupling factor ABC transporter ATP-binding protein [Enterococcus hirae]
MEPIIKVEHLKYRYNEEDDWALKDISFSVAPGEWVAIIGHNGSGKSTMAKALNGLITPAAGTVEVAGMTLSEDNVWEIRKNVGMVFQNPDNQFVGATVEDDVAFGLENRGVPRPEMVKRVTEALVKVRMSDFATREPASLSGGQKQRVAIAGVVAARPKIIILDEATSMLDPEGRIEVIQTIRAIKKEEKLTVLSITHDIDEAALASRILVVEDGKILMSGTPEEIFSFGPRLMELGLDLPYPEKLKAALRKRGITVPQEYMTEERLVDWLWTSVSNM